MYKQHEAIDGLNINMMMPLGSQFQVGGQWTLSNSKGAGFEFTSASNNSNGNPYQQPEEVQQVHMRFGSDKTGMVMGAFNLPWGIACQTQTVF